MKFNIKSALESINQPFWWLWCVLFIPSAFLNLDYSSTSKITSEIKVLLFISFVCQIFYGGFVVNYVKSFSENLSVKKFDIDFLKIAKIGCKYVIFTTIIYVLFILLMMLVGIVCVLLSFAIAHLGKIALTFYFILALIPIIMLTVKFAYLFLTLVFYFIETLNCKVLVKYKDLNLFIKSEWKNMTKYFFMVFGWTIVFAIVSLFFIKGLYPLCKPLAIILESVMLYFSSIFVSNLSAQLLYSCRPAMYEFLKINQNTEN